MRPVANASKVNTSPTHLSLNTFTHTYPHTHACALALNRGDKRTKEHETGFKHNIGHGKGTVYSSLYLIPIKLIFCSVFLMTTGYNIDIDTKANIYR